MFGRPNFSIAALVIACGLVLAGCGSGEDRPGQVTSESDGGSESGSASGSSSGAGGETAPSSAEGGYEPVSDVDAHAAIGGDIAALEGLLDDDPVDWDAVWVRWREGGASKKSDGSVRTLHALNGEDEVTAYVDDAISGSEGSDQVRAQRVAKGVSVVLARKVAGELEAARKKLAAGQTAPGDGAPHNVDEAWAFFTAGGKGLASTADKRAADFDRAGRVREPIVEALARAQKAAGAGDVVAFDEAASAVSDGIDYVFYLAVHKYLGAGDAKGRAEGATFYLALAATVQGADTSADEAIRVAFASGDDPTAGRAALHRAPVLEALGVDASDRVG